MAFACAGVDRDVGRYQPRVETAGNGAVERGDGATAGLGPGPGMQPGDGGLGGAAEAFGGGAGEQVATGGIGGAETNNGRVPGATCEVGTDCDSLICDPRTKRCSLPTCADGVRNGDESSVDCGIVCTRKCQTTETCNVAGDCEATDTCASGRCAPRVPSGKLLPPNNWRASASDQHPDAPAANAIDGLDETSFISGRDQTAGMWFELDMLKTQSVSSIQIDCNDAASCDDPADNELPGAIDIAFSDTGNWAEAQPVLSNQVVAAHAVVTLPQVGMGRYMRITLTQGKARWWRMDELRLLQ